MRDRLCRGKSVNTEEWAYGYYYVEDNDTPYPEISMIHLPYSIDRGGKVAIKVIPESVGQKLCRKDVNEKEMFEDDILEFTVFDHNDNDTQHKGVISWNDKLCEFYIRSAKEDGYFDGDYYNFVWVFEQDCEIKVIGNLTDNPDILKENTK